eukprot:scaffold4107_cov95-Isochrysis_galbana.AAC.1
MHVHAAMWPSPRKKRSEKKGGWGQRGRTREWGASVGASGNWGSSEIFFPVSVRVPPAPALSLSVSHRPLPLSVTLLRLSALALSPLSLLTRSLSLVAVVSVLARRCRDDRPSAATDNDTQAQGHAEPPSRRCSGAASAAARHAADEAGPGVGCATADKPSPAPTPSDPPPSPARGVCSPRLPRPVLTPRPTVPVVGGVSAAAAPRVDGVRPEIPPTAGAKAAAAVGLELGWLPAGGAAESWLDAAGLLKPGLKDAGWATAGGGRRDGTGSGVSSAGAGLRGDPGAEARPAVVSAATSSSVKGISMSSLDVRRPHPLPVHAPHRRPRRPDVQGGEDHPQGHKVAPRWRHRPPGVDGWLDRLLPPHEPVVVRVRRVLRQSRVEPRSLDHVPLRNVLELNHAGFGGRLVEASVAVVADAESVLVGGPELGLDLRRPERQLRLRRRPFRAPRQPDAALERVEPHLQVEQLLVRYLNRRRAGAVDGRGVGQAAAGAAQPVGPLAVVRLGLVVQRGQVGLTHQRLVPSSGSVSKERAPLGPGDAADSVGVEPASQHGELGRIDAQPLERIETVLQVALGQHPVVVHVALGEKGGGVHPVLAEHCGHLVPDRLLLHQLGVVERVEDARDWRRPPVAPLAPPARPHRFEPADTRLGQVVLHRPQRRRHLARREVDLAVEEPEALARRQRLLVRLVRGAPGARLEQLLAMPQGQCSAAIQQRLLPRLQPMQQRAYALGFLERDGQQVAPDVRLGRPLLRQRAPRGLKCDLAALPLVRRQRRRVRI